MPAPALKSRNPLATLATVVTWVFWLAAAATVTTVLRALTRPGARCSAPTSVAPAPRPPASA